MRFALVAALCLSFAALGAPETFVAASGKVEDNQRDREA